MAEVTEALELSEVIAGLRTELEKAQEAGKGQAINFGVEGIEIELDVAIAKAVDGEGKFVASAEMDDFSLLKYVVGKVKGEFSVSGKGHYKKVATQKIKLVLSAKDKDGKSPNLSQSGEKRR
jgi:hypothetical protein